MNIKQHIPTVCLCLLCFAGGCLTGFYLSQGETVTMEENAPLEVKGDVQTETKIVYVPKETVGGEKEKTDLQADIGKTDFVIKVNGQEQTFTKTDEEKYVFDANKLSMTQTSKVELDVNVPTWDNTKRWAVGVGYGNDGMAYTVDFPICKSDRVGGWAYRDNDSTAVGVKIKF